MPINVRKATVIAGILDELVITHQIGYLDAVLMYCEREGLEVETMKTLLAPRIVDAIELEAAKLRLLKDNRIAEATNVFDA
jgi:hypothetical protein